MTGFTKWWLLCAVSLSCVARFGSCSRRREANRAQPEHLIFNELCALKDEKGPCKAIKDRFFFNVDNGHCELFEYGGCGGNANNFETLEECEETCVVSDNKTPCHLSEAPGPCRGLLSRYYYDSRSQQCTHFFYGGCFGNANNFRSMAECQAKCQSPAKPTEDPVNPIKEQPIMGHGEPATFDHQVQTNNTSQEATDVKPTDLCSFPTDPGTCDGKERRFTYNSITKRCQAFIYSGCGGNENNFVFRKNCIAKCKGRKGGAHRRIIRIKKKNIDYILNRST
ncbi:tissue factor pathway inhibitor a [Takifugu rubripes]|uniref:Tissue factor pathway inhibitor n=1 Tax=Takifugu rubripes TaxID=31033 RepID=H2SXR5_TAKRU|nr:tissue factor pathway inhibitor-like [Takifugu rubripes]